MPMRFDTTLLNRGHQGRLVLQEGCGCRRDALLNFPGGKSPAALGTSPSSRDKKKARNIITVPASLLHRVGEAQSLAVFVEQSACEGTGGWLAASICAAARMHREQYSGLLPEFAIDDWLVLTRMADLQVANFALVDRVREYFV